MFYFSFLHLEMYYAEFGLFMLNKITFASTKNLIHISLRKYNGCF